jgi:hypothetical protein
LPPTDMGAVGKAWHEVSASFDRFAGGKHVKRLAFFRSQRDGAGAMLTATRRASSSVSIRL